MTECPVCSAWVSSKKVVHFFLDRGESAKDNYPAVLQWLRDCIPQRCDWFRHYHDGIEMNLQGFRYLVACRLFPDGKASKDEFDCVAEQASKIFAAIAADQTGATVEGLAAKFRGHIH